MSQISTHGGVDSFRVVPTILVVAFHAFLYWAAAGDQSAIGANNKVDLVNRSIGLKLLSFANMSVDGLIVLSGFLAGSSFLASLAHSSPSSSLRPPSGFSLRKYLTKKAKRILVPYWLTLLATLAVVQLPTRFFDPIFDREYCPRTLVLSPLLLNNFIGFGGCGVHLWSVAVQMHLFLVFGVGCKSMLAWDAWGRRSASGDTPGGADPVVVKRRMGQLAVAALITTTALRVILAVRFGSDFPPPPFDHPGLNRGTKQAAMYYYHVLYFATPSRVTNFVVGVLLSLMLSTARPWTARARRVLLVVTTSVTFAYLGLLASVDYRGRAWGPWASALLFHGSPMSSLVMALLLASAIAYGQPSGSNQAIVKKISDKSYLIYLFHPLLMRTALWVRGLWGT